MTAAVTETSVKQRIEWMRLVLHPDLPLHRLVQAEGLNHQQASELARLWTNLGLCQRPWTYAQWAELYKRLIGHL